jgi:hypothetical protein
MADEMREIVDTPQLGVKTKTTEDGKIETIDMIDHRRLQVDTRKWLLARMLPAVYGDRKTIDANVNVSVGDALAALRDREKRNVACQWLGALCRSLVQVPA